MATQLTILQSKMSRNNEVAMAKGHVYKKAMQDAKDEAAHVKPQVAILKGLRRPWPAWSLMSGST
jgi:hypothetical protein